jgi:hypothetical protein
VILRTIYRMLLRLRPKMWRDEMLDVFEQAREDARAKGWLAYGAFGLREFAGLLHVERGTGKLRWAAGGALVGLLAGWAVTLATPEIYTSRATIRAVPSMIPERFAPASPALTIEALRMSMFPVLFSRTTLVNIIQTYDLFRPERARMPMEDIIDLMRQAIEIQQADHQTMRLAFSYADRHAAQRVTRDLMTRLIDETLRQRHALSMMTVSFLSSQANRAASTWEDLNDKVRKAGPGAERLLMDRDLASRRYVMLREQVIEAEAIAALEERRQGPTLEVMDLPSLPERPHLSHAMILTASALGGLVIGFLAGWLRRLRLAATSAPAMIGA